LPLAHFQILPDHDHTVCLATLVWRVATFRHVFLDQTNVFKFTLLDDSLLDSASPRVRLRADLVAGATS
jgi:hypothetical protein